MCHTYKPADEFGRETKSMRLRSYCSKCRCVLARQTRAKKLIELNVESLGLTVVMARFGLSHVDYYSILAGQNGRCLICASDSPGKGHKRFLVDHDHATGKLRGLLCTYCNTGIGMFRDRPDLMLAAIKYLNEARRRLEAVLSGVGDGETVENIKKVAVHHRRSLSPEEMATIPCEWLAIPAVDQFSEEG